MKFKAFTLIDLLVGMTIGSIVISMGIGAYSSLNNALIQNKLYRKEIIGKSELRNILVNDSEKSVSLQYSDDRLLIIQREQIIVFQNIDNSVVRSVNGTSDTLEVKGYLEYAVLEHSILVETILFTSDDGWKFEYHKDYKSLILE